MWVVAHSLPCGQITQFPDLNWEAFTDVAHSYMYTCTRFNGQGALKGCSFSCATNQMAGGSWFGCLQLGSTCGKPGGGLGC